MKARKAKVQDIGELCRLWKKLEAFYGNKPSAKEEREWRKETAGFITNSSKGGAFVAVGKGKIMGYLLYKFVKGQYYSLRDCVFLSELYVEPEFRNKGVATRLVKRLFGIRQPKFAKSFMVTASPEAKEAIRLYKGLGFKVAGKTKAGNVKMEKSL